MNVEEHISYHPNPSQAFSDLSTLLFMYDPIELLAQMALTHLMVPREAFQAEDSEVVDWSRKIEFLCGLLLTRPYPADSRSKPTGEDLQKVEELLSVYLREVEMDMVLGESEAKKENPWLDAFLNQMKAYAMFVRGDAYPHQTLSFARELYTPHDEWFRSHLGFTIDQALRIAAAIPVEYGRRSMAEKALAMSIAPAEADEYISSGQATDGEREQVELAIACHHYFGRSSDILAFSDEELSEFSGVPLEACQRFLERMSQEFGYRNPDFPNTFTDPISAPVDYNTLKERPLITRDGRYWYLAPPVLKPALLQTFFFDLFRDKTYGDVFNAARGAFVEKKTAEYLARVFPAESVILNPEYPDGNELCDVLVMHDRKLIIIQCKAKGLTYHSSIGANFKKVTNDLKKGIADAFMQGTKAREHLQSSPTPVIALPDRLLEIDMTQVNGIYIVNVTLSSFQHLATRFANLPTTGLFTSNEYPWSLSLGSLDIITHLLDSPARFIQYMARRLTVEKTSFAISGDETDLLSFHLTRGLTFEDEESAAINALGIAGFSSDIDEYVFNLFELGASPAKPTSPMPPGFKELVEGIESIGAEYGIDCAMLLLDLSSKARKGFMEGVDTCKQRTRADRKFHSLSFTLANGKSGVSFVCVGEDDKQQLSEIVKAWSLSRLEEGTATEWVTLGWHADSGRAVDAACYGSLIDAPAPL